MKNTIEIKHYEDIRIDKETSIKVVVDEKGNKYLPYRETLNGVFKSKYQTIMKELKPELNEHFIKIKTKIYIPLYDFKYIFRFIDNDEVRLNIMSQAFRTPKPKISAVDKVETALKTISNVHAVCGQLYEQIHEFDCKQGDLLHNIENEQNNKKIYEFSKELKSVRKQRRKAKDTYQAMNYVKTFLDDKKVNSVSLSNLGSRFSEIKKEIESKEIIYFNRSAESNNKAEMEKKLKELKNHFK